LAFWVTLALAGLSYRFIEGPVLSWVRRGSGGRLWTGFLRPAGTILTLLAAVVCTINLAAAFLGWPHPGSSPKSPRLYPTDRSEEIIVVGPSHAAMGIATPELGASSYNLAFESQDLWYDCEVAKLAQTKLPNLKCVVFTVGVFSFRYAITDSDTDRWREALYYHAWGIPSRLRDADERRYGPLVLANAADTLECLRAKALLVIDPRRGWNPCNRLGTFDANSGPTAVKRHCSHGPARVEENKRLFVSSIRRLEAAGLKCILVETPKHRAYLAQLSSDRLLEHRAGIADICRQTHAAHFDYSSNHGLDESHFFDADHLNEKGAIAFTRRLNTVVIAPLVAGVGKH
jgi:hypothetical protein